MVAAGAFAFGVIEGVISKLLGSPDWLTGGTSTVSLAC